MLRRLSVNRTTSCFTTRLLCGDYFRFLQLVATVAIFTSCTLGQSQILNWKSPINGSFSEPNNWLPSNVPDSPAETVVFNLFGNYAVDFDQPLGGSLNELEATEGTIRFYSSTGVKTLSIDNDVLIEDSKLELDRKTSLGDLHLTIDGELSLSEGAVLNALKQSSLTANSTTIGAGNNSDATELFLDNDAIANLGNTAISNTGNGSFDGLLSVFNSAIATVGNLDIATTGQANRNGAVQVFSGGTINQPAGITTVGANSDEGMATLFAGFGGQFIGDEVHVFKNGKVNNHGGHVVFENSLQVDGGIYLESGNATRALGANASVTLNNKATATFVNSVLLLANGQSIEVEDSTLNSSEAIQIVGGSLTVTGATPIVNAPLDILNNGSVVIRSNTTAKFTQPVSNDDGTITIESGALVDFESSYAGVGTTGPGIARFSGEVSLGMSPGVVTFGGDIEWTNGARHIIEIGGTALGNWDQTIVANNASLDGELVVELIDLGNGIYEPMVGDTFEVIQAAAREGRFETISLPSLSTGSRWIIDYATDGVQLSVVSPGDYNGDGQVDAADYTVWRDQLGQSGQFLAADGNNDGIISELDYGTWVANYGFNSNLNTAASLDTASFDGTSVQTVPEPYSLMLIAFGILNCLPIRQISKD